jgi:radical SAM protein with 4Fe4S-binding SPASM domain
MELKAVQLETTNRCNADCVFCPNSRHTKRGVMADRLFGKIIDEIRQLPSVVRLAMNMAGEPLMDPDFVDRLEHARAVVPSGRCAIDFITNGSFLNGEVMERLAKLDNFSMCVSVNGIDKQMRERFMHVDDYEHVMGVLELGRRLGLNISSSMVRLPSITPEECSQFMRGRRAAVGDCANWAGELFDYPDPDEPRPPCDRAMHYLTVLYTGQVALCCNDLFGSYDFGDLNDQTCLEVWESTSRREIARQMMNNQRGLIEKCRNCGRIA